MNNKYCYYLQAVNNFRNETGYTKRIRKAVQSAASGSQTQAPVQRPPLKLASSRQQDPLMANVQSSTPASTPPQSMPAALSPPPSLPSSSTPPPPASSSTVQSSSAPAVSNYSPTVDSPQHSTKQDDPPLAK